MHFKNFSEFLNKIEQTNGRTEMTMQLADFLGQLKTKEIKYAMYLLQGRLVPKYVDLEFKISGKLLLRALEQLIAKGNVLNSEDPAQIIKEHYHRLGDVGLVAEEVIKKVRQEGKDIETKNGDGPDILEVYAKLKAIAESAGKGSQEDKMTKYQELILTLDLISVRYVTRIIVGAIRLGISEKTILDSLSWFKNGDKTLRKELDIAYGARADVGELAEIIISSKADSKSDIKELLKAIKVKPGTPLASKLVEREASSAAVCERMPDCFVQPKLDGLRGQIHFERISSKEELSEKDKLQAQSTEKVEHSHDGTDHLTAIYSRNMENMTSNYPELTKAASELKVDSIILDSEIIGYNSSETRFFSYQDTMKRRRKYDIEEYAKSIPVKAMCFDIIYLNGKDLTQEPIEERLKLLKEILSSQKNNDCLEMLETKQMHSEEELEEYFKSKVENGLEGIITKEKGSNYEPGTRNFKWIKLKANTRSDLVDTIDVAVLGFYIGRGDRSQFGFGALLAGVYDPKEDKYYSIGKVGSGFTEEEMGVMLKDMNKLKIKDNKQPENVVVDKSLYPDVWLEPKIVMEIDADEITRSPNHTAAKGVKAKVKNDDFSKGLSIRFPRMKKWMRDKDYPNNVDEIIRMYELRKGDKTAEK